MLLFWGSASADVFRRVHPQDGPHADIRIRIDDEKVRLDLIFNLVFLDEIIEAPRENSSKLHPVEYPGVQQALFEWLRTANEVAIDGVVIPPKLERFEVPEPDLTLSSLFPKTGLRGLSRVHIIVDYPVLQPPEKVAIHWAGYPPDTIQYDDAATAPPLEIEAQLMAYGRTSIIRFKESEPEHVWHGTGETIEDTFEPVPEAVPGEPVQVSMASAALIALALVLLVLAVRFEGLRRFVRFGVPLLLVAAWLCAPVTQVTVPWLDDGSELPSRAEAKDIFRPLHANIYRAFAYDQESDVYDALSRSVSGELLDDLYNQIYQTLILRDDGGAVCQVQDVRPMETEIEAVGQDEVSSEPTFQVKARWQVDGSVYHFGHSHFRTNEYQARYTAKRTGDGWRITGHQMLEQFVVGAEPGSFDSEGETEVVPFELPPGEDF
ncbi:MAG: hypothetical protein RL885_13210 [Planctomycetota bacterium]